MEIDRLIFSLLSVCSQRVREGFVFISFVQYEARHQFQNHICSLNGKEQIEGEEKNSGKNWNNMKLLSDSRLYNLESMNRENKLQP